ncbi:hypothetical protein CLAFUW4_03781 [Fulvia fulva]|uniref:Uncharacterized protein n=1 Tax=Passalora fulva TaxID=5499 RepID=A0A9Q8LBD8_PASFU|nr:uncharacterized protein CLAFUR5_03753 [Fulvia fulva]KAK4631964.1 hypothetical protein CLAFUR4_03769 [Fulvia fulva]KAK4633158.1 hypothetical protein CLAFUR0_03768 [Fulvia fulva]UJO14261.1 hypothetical protein CLAFUR5_03753 [Fulvia fulva]WPV10628.1 hypothetical protein CLAFUW4_03781 [Fulvia fulva]WPV26454.1 hypothetical protein CLAFUW7_03773 [Fulvia fulva]
MDPESQKKILELEQGLDALKQRCAELRARQIEEEEKEDAASPERQEKIQRLEARIRHLLEECLIGRLDAYEREQDLILALQDAYIAQLKENIVASWGEVPKPKEEYEGWDATRTSKEILQWVMDKFGG